MSKRILIIEDDEMTRNLLSEALGQEGFDISLAENGEQGLMLFREDPFELVITDIIMPGQSGIEVVTDIKRRWPQTKIIVITGADESERAKLLHISKVLGADSTLQKPISKESLLSMIESM